MKGTAFLRRFPVFVHRFTQLDEVNHLRWSWNFFCFINQLLQSEQSVWRLDLCAFCLLPSSHHSILSNLKIRIPYFCDYMRKTNSSLSTSFYLEKGHEPISTAEQFKVKRWHIYEFYEWPVNFSNFSRRITRNVIDWFQVQCSLFRCIP